MHVAASSDTADWICDGCMALFDKNHALKCNNGGLMISTHDELNYTIQDLGKAALGGSNVRDEPRTKLGCSTASKGNDADGGAIVEDHQRRGDFLLHGFWERNMSLIVDFRFGNLDAASYVDKDYRDILSSWEAAKKRKHKADMLLPTFCQQ